MTQVAQAVLTSGDTTLVAWIPLEKGVKVDATISLKGNDRRWVVQSLGAPRDEQDIPNRHVERA